MPREKAPGQERRKHPRLASLRLISYVSTADGLPQTGVSMARTLDVSPAGVRVEVYEPVKPGSLMEMEIAVEEEIFPVSGKVIYSEEGKGGLYVIGIQFEEKQDRLC